jgi:hypothetical protein
LSVFAQGEQVERIELTAGAGGGSVAKLVTVSGKRFDAPPQAFAIAGSGS